MLIWRQFWRIEVGSPRSRDGCGLYPAASFRGRDLTSDPSAVYLFGVDLKLNVGVGNEC